LPAIRNELQSINLVEKSLGMWGVMCCPPGVDGRPGFERRVTRLQWAPDLMYHYVPASFTHQIPSTGEKNQSSGPLRPLPRATVSVDVGLVMTWAVRTLAAPWFAPVYWLFLISKNNPVRDKPVPFVALQSSQRGEHCAFEVSLPCLTAASGQSPSGPLRFGPQ